MKVSRQSIILVSDSNVQVDLAKYVDALLGFISKFAKGFYSSGKVACKDDSELSLEVADNMQQPSKALEVCCKIILKHIELLCQPQLTYSKSFQGSMTSRDSIKGVIKDAFTQCVKIIDVLHKLDTSNSRAVVIQSILSVAKISFSNSSLFFPLVQQWIKMLCEDFSDVNGMDAAPSLYKRLLFRCSKLPWNIMGEILEQDFLAYDQLGAWNPVLCHKMEIKVIDLLLMNVFNHRDFILQISRVFLRKGLVLRTRGIENLISCFDCISEAIILLVSAKNEKTFFAGQIYYNLTERLFTGGRVFEHQMLFTLKCTDARHHFMVINDLHTMPRDPVTFSKGVSTHCVAVLTTNCRGSIPPPLCLQGSLSLSHWAAFFHQASIGSIVNYQYLSFLRDKECNFKAYKLS